VSPASPPVPDGQPSPAERDATEGRVAAVLLAVLLAAGAAMGLVNLAVDGVVRDGATRWVYTATLAACLVTAVLLLVRRRIGRGPTFGLVLLSDLVYVVVASGTEDPVRYATPLLLLPPALVAAWFLRTWMLAVNMVATPLAVLVAMWSSYPDPVGLAVQVGVNAGMLDLVAVAVHLLRRRERRLLAAAEALTLRDPLTGLANRRHLVEQAPRTWRQARREGLQVAAMVIDLDHFKQVNDVHGHAVGDAVLQSVARALAVTVRPSDLLARLGGEELVVVGLVGDPREAGRLAERLRLAVAAARTGDGHAVTASIGIALTRPVDGEDAPAALWWLLDRADAAMYEAKQAGRDRVAGFIPPRPRSTPDDERLGPPTVPGPALPGPAPSDAG